MRKVLCGALLAFLLTEGAHRCTFFMSTFNGKTFFGNNEDSHMSQSNIWFIPAQTGKYGYVYFGYNNGWPQGGMNDQGLCFDGAATPKVNIHFSADKRIYRGYLPDKIMEECAAVSEVPEIFETYRFPALTKQAQVMFADKEGHAVIIGGPDPDGDLDIIRKEKPFMVSTNFFPNHPETDNFPSVRYDTAVQRLQDNPEPSVKHFRSKLEEANVQYTQHSNIFDLNNRIITVYHSHDFKNPVVIRLEDKLKKGPHAYRIASMFPHSGWDEDLNDLNTKKAEKRQNPHYASGN